MFLKLKITSLSPENPQNHATEKKPVENMYRFPWTLSSFRALAPIFEVTFTMKRHNNNNCNTTWKSRILEALLSPSKWLWYPFNYCRPIWERWLISGPSWPILCYSISTKGPSMKTLLAWAWKSRYSQSCHFISSLDPVGPSHEGLRGSVNDVFFF